MKKKILLALGMLLLLGVGLFAQYDTKTGRLPYLGGVTESIKFENEALVGTEEYTLVTLLAVDPPKAKKVVAGSTSAAGICVYGCGTSGDAVIATGGKTQCQFDGAVISGNWVGISATTDGKCTDLGATRPTTGRLMARLLETNAGAGTYEIMLLGVGTMGALQAVLPSDASKYYDGTGVFSTPPSGGAPSFDAITNGTNLSAAMVVGTGASLGYSGSGAIDASKIQNVAVSGTPAVGQIPIASSGTAAAWGDPLVSGFTAHDAPGGTTNPVAIGGFASAAAPADVSLDVDIVRGWFLRNGSPVVNLATGGTLYDARQIRALSSGTDSVAVTGTFWQATQPVSGTFWQATQPVSIASMPTTPVTGTFWQATQPISGTVTANAGSGTFTVDGSGVTQPVSGTFWQATQPVSSTQLPAALDGLNLKVHEQGTVPVTGTFWQATQPVSGTFWQATQPVSGTVTANAGTGTFTVDGSGVTQPVSGTFWQATQPVSGTVTANVGTFPDNEPFNIAQINAVIPLMGNGATGTGSQRVTISSDNSPVSGMGVGATGAAPPANANLMGGISSGATGGFLLGIPVCDSFYSINIATATTVLAVTGVSGRHVYICGISLVTALANNVALISGTGATCGTSTAGMTGGTTAAAGYNFAANGGITQGSGLGAINRTETTGDSVCIVTSATTQLSGALSYAIY